MQLTVLAEPGCPNAPVLTGDGQVSGAPSAGQLRQAIEQALS